MRKNNSAFSVRSARGKKRRSTVNGKMQLQRNFAHDVKNFYLCKNYNYEKVIRCNIDIIVGFGVVWREIVRGEIS